MEDGLNHGIVRPKGGLLANLKAQSGASAFTARNDGSMVCGAKRLGGAKNEASAHR
jgi:hypothetical protein